MRVGGGQHVGARVADDVAKGRKGGLGQGLRGDADVEVADLNCARGHCVCEGC